MDKLYTRLAHVWDELFPPDAERHNFLRGRIGKPDHEAIVVELGCATGSSSMALSETGYSVQAGDPDKTMIAIAQRRVCSKPTQTLPTFVQQDMLGQLAGIPDSLAQGIICLGNTLPHLDNDKELMRFFQESERVLKPTGSLIIQLMNVRRIRRLGEIRFPELKAGDLIFRRMQKYNEDSGTISFFTEVESAAGKEERHHELMAINLEEWERPDSDMLMTEYAESWDGKAAHADSIWLAAVYQRGLG